MQKKTHEEYLNELFLKEINYIPLEIYKGSLIPIIHTCINDHLWSVSPNNVLKRRQCPECRKNV